LRMRGISGSPTRLRVGQGVWPRATCRGDGQIRRRADLQCQDRVVGAIDVPGRPFVREHLRGYAAYHRIVGHVPGHDSIRAYRHVRTYVHATHDFRAGPDVHVVADGRRAFSLTSVGLTKGNPLRDVAVAPDRACLVHDDAAEVSDVESWAYLRRRWNRDAVLEGQTTLHKSCERVQDPDERRLGSQPCDQAEPESEPEFRGLQHVSQERGKGARSCVSVEIGLHELDEGAMGQGRPNQVVRVRVWAGVYIERPMEHECSGLDSDGAPLCDARACRTGRHPRV